VKRLTCDDARRLRRIPLPLPSTTPNPHRRSGHAEPREARGPVSSLRPSTPRARRDTSDALGRVAKRPEAALPRPLREKRPRRLIRRRPPRASLARASTSRRHRLLRQKSRGPRSPASRESSPLPDVPRHYSVASMKARPTVWCEKPGAPSARRIRPRSPAGVSKPGARPTRESPVVFGANSSSRRLLPSRPTAGGKRAELRASPGQRPEEQSAEHAGR